MPKGKYGSMGMGRMDGGSVPGGGMKDGSRMAAPPTNMNGRIDPGMPASINTTMSKMTGMPKGGQVRGSAMAKDTMAKKMR